MAVHLDIEGIFTYFGLKASEQSRRESIKKLQVRMKQTLDCTIGAKTVEAWFMRKSVPTEHLINFARLARHEKRPFDLTLFLLKGSSTRGR